MMPMQRPGRTIERQELERLRALNTALVAALKPFAVADQPSLSATLGHINRAHIATARAVVAKARSQA